MFDSRFPAWTQWVFRRFSFVAIPNLGVAIAGLAVLAFVGVHLMGLPLERFMFDPIAVLDGEYWRLFAFPGIETRGNLVYLLFYVLYVVFVYRSLEEYWGTAPVTIFTLFAYLCAMAASFLTGRALPVWFHVLQNVSLAFGTLFPELELYLFFVLPVKAKWLAALAGAILVLQFVTGDNATRVFVAVCMAPYLAFFGPMLYRALRSRMRQR